MMGALLVTDEKVPPPSTLKTARERNVRLVEPEKIISIRPLMHAMLSEKSQWEFKLSSAVTMSSSGTGIVNSTLGANTVTSVTEFTSFGAIFDEYFVRGFTAHWMPVARYQGPLTWVPGTNLNSMPIGCATLQHSASAYTALGQMGSNSRFAYHSTGDPFTYSWRNVESPTSVNLDITSGNTQSWALTNGSVNYTGFVQFLSNSAPPALPVSTVLGTFVVVFDVLFRCRV
jgi:hypothetical protein